MKTIELTKSAPRWKSVFAIAEAAYEQDDEAAPNRVARADLARAAAAEHPLHLHPAGRTPAPPPRARSRA